MNAIETGKHQALSREVNERVRDINEPVEQVGGVVEFVCECAQPGCSEHLRMSLSDYEEIRRVPTHFAVAAGMEHVFPDVERIFAKRDGYFVVETFGQAGVAAIKLDPRSRRGRFKL